MLRKWSEDKTKYDHFQSSSKAEIMINESDIEIGLNKSILQLQQIYQSV